MYLKKKKVFRLSKLFCKLILYFFVDEQEILQRKKISLDEQIINCNLPWSVETFFQFSPDPEIKL